MKTRGKKSRRAAKRRRYLNIARDLRRAIARRSLPARRAAPTEHALCRELGVALHHPRGDPRAVHRRPGAPQAALGHGRCRTARRHALHPRHRLAARLLPVRAVAHFHYVYIGRIGLSRAQARAVAAAPGEAWIHAVALRRESPGGKPFGVTRLFLNPALKGIEKALRGTSGPVYALIERDFKVRIDRVEQVITAVALDEHDAANLGVAAGTPGRHPAQLLRREDRVVEMAETVHPADRFAYRMELRR
jgi:DNA-binding GntR family transcriptional regulator